MQLKRNTALTAALLVAVSLGGCPPTPSNPTVLTAAQQAAIDLVAQQLQAFGEALGALAELEDPELDLDSLPQIAAVGDCPRIGIASAATWATFAFDFGTQGCSNAATGGLTYAGQAVLVRVDPLSSGTIAIEIVALTIDGVAVTAELSGTITQGDTSGTTLALTIDQAVTTAGVGTVTGTLTMNIAPSGVITITTANVTVSNGTTNYTVTLSNVVLDPAGNSSFVPESGTATFTIAGVSLVVTFDAQSPTGGSVQVAADGADNATYVIGTGGGG